MSILVRLINSASVATQLLAAAALLEKQAGGGRERDEQPWHALSRAAAAHRLGLGLDIRVDVGIEVVTCLGRTPTALGVRVAEALLASRGAGADAVAWNEPCRRGAAGTQLKINNLHRAARYGISNFKMTPSLFEAYCHAACRPIATPNPPDGNPACSDDHGRP
jgi:hypothetical protein